MSPCCTLSLTSWPSRTVCTVPICIEFCYIDQNGVSHCLYLSLYASFVLMHVDIQFWNKNKSMEGLSAKSVVLNFICQVIIFLYLLDNETSWMILMSSGVGLCIEFWKIGKAMHVEVILTYLKFAWNLIGRQSICQTNTLVNFSWFSIFLNWF